MSETDARISPTAHYTGYVWFRNGLSHPAFATLQGRALYQSLRPVNAVSRRLGGPTLEGLLLARHHAIDEALSAAIQSGHVSQVVEIAAGLSPRGWDFARRHGDNLDYIEADLPQMAAHKAHVLAKANLGSPRHRIVALDALAADGPHSLAALTETLDTRRGVAIVTEGLLNYFPREPVRRMWRQFARALARFPYGLYLSDLHVRAHNDTVPIRVFSRALSTFVRGNVHMHFETEQEAADELRAAGFATVQLTPPAPQRDAAGRVDANGPAAVRVVEARTYP